jgi:hypothetical protein
MSELEGIAVPAGEVWAALRLALEDRFAEDLFWLQIAEDANGITVRGQVVSEDVKEAIVEIVSVTFPNAVIFNEILATSPLYPANQNHFDIDVGVDVNFEAAATVVRHPRISCEHELYVGRSYVFEVDLSLDPEQETVGAPIELTPEDPNWESLLVTVEFSSYELEIEPEDARRNITLFRGGNSKPARFAAKVKAEAASIGAANVKAIFSTADRVRGFASRRFDIIPIAQGVNPGPKILTAPGTIGDFVHDASPAPSLTVKIQHNPHSPGECTWSFEAPGFRDLVEAYSFHQINLGTSAKAYFHDKFMQVKTLQDGKHQGILRGIGEEIWGAAPVQFHRLYLAMTQKIGNAFPIQIFSDEPYVPWELMHPTASNTNDPDHLCMRHPIARWTMTRALVSTIPKGGIVSFVPDYPDGSLPAALEEGRWLCTTYGATACTPTYAAFTQCLNVPVSEPVAVLHFAGHGAGEEADPRQRGLRMTDGWVSIEEINSAVKLGNRDRSLVVVNACHAGSQTSVLGAVHGWPAAFIKVGFGAVIAPLWAVQDETACKVMKRAVAELYGTGNSLGSAVTEARRENRDKSAAAFSYVLHGDVMAHVNT